MTTYRHICFFSYTRGAGADLWYAKSKEKIEHYLQNSLGAKERQVFFDRHSIEPGHNWKQKLRDGLDRSPILVAIFSPAYFRSPYCRKELATFMERERHLGLEPGSLIHTAKVYDRKLFPRWAQDIQATPLDDYFLLDRSFWGSPKAHGFDEKIKAFADGAAAKIMTIMRDKLFYRDDFPKFDEIADPIKAGRDDADPAFFGDDLINLLGPMGPVPQPFHGERAA